MLPLGGYTSYGALKRWQSLRFLPRHMPGLVLGRLVAVLNGAFHDEHGLDDLLPRLLLLRKLLVGELISTRRELCDGD